MSRRHLTVSTILYCSQNFFNEWFVGMEIKSFKIISLQGPKLFRRCKTKALIKLMTRGVPQGSSLYALVILIYITNIFELPSRGHLQLYADDAILIYSESNYDELQRHMREDLLKIHSWLYNNLLNFNVSKRKYIIFNPNNKKNPQPNRLLVRGADEVERVRNTLNS
jgi:hypothetical protein